MRYLRPRALALLEKHLLRRALAGSCLVAFIVALVSADAAHCLESCDDCARAHLELNAAGVAEAVHSPALIDSPPRSEVSPSAGCIGPSCLCHQVPLLSKEGATPRASAFTLDHHSEPPLRDLGVTREIQHIPKLAV